MNRFYSKMGLATVADKRVEFVENFIENVNEDNEAEIKYFAYDHNHNKLGEVFPVGELRSHKNYIHPVLEFKWDTGDSYSFVGELSFKPIVQI